MTAAGPRIFVSAGEPSGDLHGAEVVRALRRRLPPAAHRRLRRTAHGGRGRDVRFPMEGFTAFGFVEIVEKMPAHFRLLRRHGARRFARSAYDLVILIDYPGFHLRRGRGRAPRRHPGAVLHRAAALGLAARSARGASPRPCDRLAVILPFEPAFFRERRRAGRVRRAPAARSRRRRRLAPRRASRSAFRPGDRVLALFPGSREQEVRRLWPLFRDAAHASSIAASLRRGRGGRHRQGDYPGGRSAHAHPRCVPHGARRGRRRLAKSGTTTLEAALADMPMVVRLSDAPAHRVPHAGA